MLAPVLPKYQQVVVDHDADPQSSEHLRHLVMEDAGAIGRPEEEPLNPV